jgi:protein TonB
LPAYRLPSPYDRPPFYRRASGLALALGVNILLFLVLLGIGAWHPLPMKRARSLTVDLLPPSKTAANQTVRPAKTHVAANNRPVPKPPPIILPVKPTITPPPPPAEKSQPWIEMSKDDLASADLKNVPRNGAGSGASGDSEVVGRGPNGETLYGVEWAREPTDAEIAGYWPRNVFGAGVIACKTIPHDRVDDCIELGQQPPGSHLASAVRQMAWQFRIRPPRRNGRELIGEWVRITIEIDQSASGDGR